VTLDEVVGQPHLTGEKGVLRRIIASGVLPSLIFWGPPGSGKTSVAQILVKACRYHMISISAVAAGVKEIRDAVKEAEDNLKLYQRKTAFFIDEIHRFHKGQQSILLPYVEEGLVTLIGSTTENPSFEIIAPLLSRAQVLLFHPLSVEDLFWLLRKALQDERGLRNIAVTVEEDVLRFVAQLADGDARQALNLLELAVSIAQGERAETLTVPFVREFLVKNFHLYDKSGEEHYNLLSAYHKSLRGSDPDGALYWLARMLEAGENPRNILRRLVACASEDVGNADPQALLLAVAAHQAFEFLGEPEGRLALAQVTVYVACAPKSNASYMALQRAFADVQEFGSLPVPLHLRNAPTAMMKKMGYGKEYRYAHDFPGAFVEQEYLPEKLRGRLYFRPSDRGYEEALRKRLKMLWKGRNY
ncbi:MAG: replication-associated recombination protein A, partial [Atribacterota bacterium]|nr:replication-associated recombination protein A [Atribacterota bacterium]